MVGKAFCRLCKFCLKMVEKSILFTKNWQPYWIYQMGPIGVIWSNDNVYIHLWYVWSVCISAIFLLWYCIERVSGPK